MKRLRRFTTILAAIGAAVILSAAAIASQPTSVTIIPSEFLYRSKYTELEWGNPDVEPYEYFQLQILPNFGGVARSYHERHYKPSEVSGITNAVSTLQQWDVDLVSNTWTRVSAAHKVFNKNTDEILDFTATPTDRWRPPTDRFCMADFSLQTSFSGTDFIGEDGDIYWMNEERCATNDTPIAWHTKFCETIPGLKVDGGESTNVYAIKLTFAAYEYDRCWYEDGCGSAGNQIPNTVTNTLPYLVYNEWSPGPWDAENTFFGSTSDTFSQRARMLGEGLSSLYRRVPIYQTLCRPMDAIWELLLGHKFIKTRIERLANYVFHSFEVNGLPVEPDGTFVVLAPGGGEITPLIVKNYGPKRHPYHFHFDINPVGVESTNIVEAPIDYMNGEFLLPDEAIAGVFEDVETGTITTESGTINGNLNLVGGKIGINAGNPVFDVTIGGTLAGIGLATSDGADNSRLILMAGGNYGANRGAAFQLIGNEFSGEPPGSVFIDTGEAANAVVRMRTSTSSGSGQTETLTLKNGTVQVGAGPILKKGSSGELEVRNSTDTGTESIRAAAGFFSGNVNASSYVNASTGVTVGPYCTITSGTGAPTSTQPNGSIYMRWDGTGPNLYVRENGAWVAK